MKIVKFIKKNYPILVVNLIALVFIAITLLVRFGVHIKVYEGADLIPVEIGYSQSAKRIDGKIVHVSECYVRFRLENSEQKPFWVPAEAAFRGASVDDIEDMIKDGDSVKRNVFFNTGSDEVIGVTEGGKSILSLYYNNSKLFRYGIWILFFVDIFVAILIIFANKKKKTT